MPLGATSFSYDDFEDYALGTGNGTGVAAGTAADAWYQTSFGSGGGGLTATLSNFQISI